jgi:transposase
MSKRIFTSEQIETLKRNPNVKNCSERSILYSNDFKIKAVKEYKEGLTGREIFDKAGFDLKIIGKDVPKGCLKSWNKIYKKKGIVGLEKDFRGITSGRRKKIEIVEKDKIKRLEAEVAYLKAENDFLIKLRAKRAK